MIGKYALKALAASRFGEFFRNVALVDDWFLLNLLLPDDFLAHDLLAMRGAAGSNSFRRRLLFRWLCTTF